MGYTNYYKIKKQDNVKEFDELFLTCVNKAIELSGVPLEYEVNSKLIDINGVGDDACENLYIVLKNTPFDYGGGSFCKTNRCPYDVVVKAVLMLADDFGYLERKLDFDGSKDDEEYKAGLDLFNRVKKSTYKTK